jgi:prepilin-type N-terminal cleavage/methylation domain-containing protein
MQKYLKNNKGFTLVEVIVVAVIVLILAAVAIPLYQGYMRDSRRAVAASTAGAVASLAGALNQTEAVTRTLAFGANNAYIVARITRAGGATDSSVVLIPVGYCIAVTANAVTGSWHPSDSDTEIDADEIIFSLENATFSGVPLSKQCNRPE